MTFHLYKRGKVNGVFAQDAVFFTPVLPSDIRTGLFNAIWNISIISLTASNFEYTLDNGVTWFPLSAGALTPNKESIYNVLCDGDDEFNLRCPDVGGCNLYRAVVSIAPVDFQQRFDLPDPLPVTVVNPAGTPIGTTILSLTNSAYVANADVSGVDLTPTGTVVGDAVIFRILWSASAIGVLKITLDSTNYVELNNGANLRAESAHLFDVVVSHGDLFNLQFDKNATLRFVRVIQLI